MWRLTFTVLMALSSGRCQYLSQQQLAPSTSGRDTSGWDIRLAVPGEPDIDYPTLSSVPKTGFTCAGKDAGYYADVETRCQVFRVCTIGATYGFQSFLCPNGTLFNQQVFVCDWWMNVNCQGSQKYYNNNDKFGNLKLGPSMMSDIKKMLTYPMSNPYNRNNLNNNQFVMQIYNPPSGQPFSNGGSVGNIADTFKNMGFRPAQQLQLPAFQNDINRYNENQFSGSTPSPQYVAANAEQNVNFINNAHRLTHLQHEQFQTSQNGQYFSSHGNEAGAVFNENNAQFGQLRNQNMNSYLQTGQNFNTQNGQYTNGHNSQLSLSQNLQSQYNNAANSQFQNGISNSQKYRFSNTQDTENTDQSNQYNQNAYQKEQQIQYANNFNGQYLGHAKQTADNGDRQNELEVTVTKQQYTYPSQHDKQYTYKITADQANTRQVGQLQEVKQNLVSETSFNTNPVAPILTSPNYSPPTVISKTININNIKSGKSLTSNIPSSRITYKTWVVQPSKSGQIVSKPTPYTYEKPKSARQFIVPPTISSRLYLTPSTSRPKIASRLYAVPSRSTSASRLYLAAPQSTVPAKLNLPVIAASTLKPSHLYLNPSTSRPSVSARVYSSLNPSNAARLTAPSSSQVPIYNRNNKFLASASTVAPVYSAPLKNDLSNKSFTITKHSLINTNHNNLTFTDILTKEKLDITVNDIVKDTSDVLETTESKLGQLREQPKNYLGVDPSPIYIPSQTTFVENKNITATEIIDTPSTKATFQSARLTQDPSISLELPVTTLRNNQTNEIATLPYFKSKDYAPQKNLENFVSLKITIPQKTAQYILQSKNESEFDSLKILTAGKSSYLVLVNKGQTSSKLRPSFIPLGKLVANKKSNFSNPQAFIYDFLANSINAAKTYENTLNENTKKFHLATANVFGQQFQNIDAEDLNEISQQISQLTTAQYNNNNSYKSKQYQAANLVSSAPTTTNIANTYRGSTKFLDNQEIQNNKQFNQIRSGQLRQSPDINGNFYSSNFYNGNAENSANLQGNPTDIQNAQLYQSDFVNQNANQQLSSNSAYNNNVNQQNLEISEFQSNRNADISNINLSKESNEVELFNTGLQSSGRSAAKLQVAPTATNAQETEIFNTVNHSTAKTPNGNAVVPNENGIGAQFHKQVVGTINHPKSDKNLITYKADKSFYVYTKYVGSGGNKETTNNENKVFGELRQSEQHSDAISNAQHSVNNGREITTVQFVPSLSFEFDDSDQRHIDNGVQNVGGSSAAYTANFNHNGFNKRVGSVPTSSVDYSLHRTKTSNDLALQHYNQAPENQYAGPSSYSAPQASIGRLEAQNGQLKVLPSQPSNGYAPARLEEFDESETDNGYPKVTPAIPFSF